MTTRVLIGGVGMIPFAKPGASAPYTTMGAQAVRLALADAGIAYDDVQQAYVGHVYGDSTSGQRVLYDIGMTSIPIINVNNNCSTGSTALFLARQAVASGVADCVLALGFEQMTPGALTSHWTDRPTPLGPFLDVATAAQGESDVPMAIRLFGGAGQEYQERFGAPVTAFAKITEKARRHAEHNENAIFRQRLSVEEILASPQMYGPLTRLQCCPPTCGAAAAIVVSPAFAARHNIRAPIAILAQSLVTDGPATFAAHSMMKVVGCDMSAQAAHAVYAESGVAPADVDVVELHDCFTANELISYEALGLTPEGTAERFIMDGENTYGGTVVTNPSGGLISKGHPLGATGLAQCAELVSQLRGTAGVRQVEGARTALQHNIGLGGACVVTMYQR
jgi:acetyl-CoA acetyltransferase